MIKITFALTEEDYLSFNKYHLANTPSGRRLLSKTRLMGPIMSLFVLILFLILGARPSLLMAETVALTILSILMVVFSKQFLWFSTKRNIRKIKKDGKLPFSPQGELLFEEDAIHEITPDSECRTSYSRLERIGITDEALYLYFGAIQAYIIPFSCLSDASEKDRILAFLHKKVQLDF